MCNHRQQLRQQLGLISREWIVQGLPSRQEIEATADHFDQWKRAETVETIWDRRPVMATATLDDGMGLGLMLIHRFAAILGFEVNHLGLLKKSDEIVDACRQAPPDILGLTVLQLDSDDELARVGCNLPTHTQLIAGGPVFKYDPDMARRCQVSYVARNVAYFIDYLLKWFPRHDASA